jgi:uncharacterized protein YjbJ (UPF0337 family)
MTDQRIEGALTEVEGQGRQGLGKLTGDTKLQVEGYLQEAKGRTGAAYGRVIDGLDGIVAKAPANLQAPARQGLDFARRKPLLTTGILAGAAILLGGLGRRR